MKNKVFKIIFLFIICTVSITTILGEGGVDGEGGSNIIVGDATKGTTWTGSKYSGIRISFVTSKGTPLASVDYVSNEAYKTYFETTIYTTKNRFNRVSYLKGSEVIFDNNSGKKFKEQGIKNVKELEDAIVSSGFSRIDIEGKLKQMNFSNLFQPIFDEVNTKANGQENFANFLEKLGLTNLSQYYDPKSGLYDVFLTFEYTTLVNLQTNDLLYNVTGERIRKVLYGTTYELANEMTKSKYTAGTSMEACVGSDNHAYCDIGLAFRKMACTVYVTGDLEEQMKNHGFNNVGFTKDSYFGGTLKIKSDMENLCQNDPSNKDLPATIIKGNYGVGIGVAWIGEFISKSSCQDVEKAFPKLKQDIETYYKIGGLKNIYNSYPNQKLSFEIDGKEKEVSLDWYVNECTCYGIYDYYETYMKNDYENKGIKDYKIIPLYESKLNAIKNKTSVFTGYNEQIKRGPENKGFNYTTWNYEKYEKLNCGSKESYGCEEFESWYGENKTSSDPALSSLKGHSQDWIINNYGDKLTAMINKYNTIYYPSTGFKWSLNQNKNIGNTVGQEVRSYLDRCLNTINIDCNMIVNFYAADNIQKLSKTKIEKFDFTAYNKKYGTNITGNEYIEAGCPYTKGNFNCTPEYQVGNCTDRKSIIYKDSSSGIIDEEYWENCVFNDYGDYDINVHKNSVTYFDEELSGDYCKTYCIETVNTFLPSGDLNIEAGRFFIWGEGRVIGSRTCRTESIDYKQFEADLKMANDKTIDAYYEWQFELAKQNAIDAAKITEQSEDCPVYHTITLTSTNYYNSNGTFDRCEGNCNEPAPSGYTCSEAIETSTKYANGNYKTRTWIKQCQKVIGYEDEYQTSKVTGSITLPDNTKKTYTYGAQNWCAGNAPKTNVSSKKTAYDNALSSVNSVINGMESCYNWNESSIYNVNPILKLDYSDSINYRYYDDLVGNTDYSITDTGTSCKNAYVYKNSCTNGICKSNSVQMKECSVVEMTRSADTIFTLPDNLYRYILKDGNLSVSYKPTGYRYVDVGYSNLPVSYSIKDGKHGQGIDSSKLNLYYSNLGHISNAITLDSILRNTSNDYGNWICKFNTYSGIIGEDINVEYRLIDLVNPFPDINAGMRETGSNWCTPDGDCDYDNYIVLRYINDNRNVEDYDLYTIEPMYTFILTPSDIKEIRKYNSKNSYTSYTGYYNGKSYDYKCDTKTGTACISDYFTHLLEITDSHNNPGSCTNIKYRSYNDTNNFEACRYLGK